MRKRLFLAAMAMVTSFALLTACGNTGGGDKQGEAPAAETIKIGGLAPLTGAVAVYGTAASNGAKLAIAEINEAGGLLGKKIDYIEHDEKGDSVEAVNAYNRLIRDNIVALIGDVTSKPTISVAQKASADGIPMISPTATAAEVTTYGENIFRACFLDPTQGEVMAKFAAQSLNVTTAAVMYNTSDDYSDGVAKAFRESAAKFGIEVVAFEGYGKDDKDFKSQLTNIHQKKPQALFVPDYYNTVALIATQAKEVGLTATFLGADGWDGVLSALDANSQNVVDGAYFCNHYSTEDTSATVQDFLKNYSAKYGEQPNSFAALGYDAAQILFAAIEKAGTTDKEAVVKAMTETDIEGVTGHINYDENRNPIKSISITKIQDGKYSLAEKVTP